MQQQSAPSHRSHSSYSYQHSRTTTGSSPSGTYREHSIPIAETGISSRAGEKRASGSYILINTNMDSAYLKELTDFEDLNLYSVREWE